jgi:hypothetical protein
MQTKSWRLIQAALFIAMIAAALRLYLIYRERHELPQQKQETPAALDADTYVVPKKIYAYNLKSARVLIGQPVWIKAGYGVAIYPYNPANKRADIRHQAGSLGPIQKIQIVDVVQNPVPSDAEWQGRPGARFRIHQEQQSVLAVYSDAGKTYAFPIGSVQNGEYHFLIDDLLFVQDPHQLYSHWPPETWRAIEQHQVKPGMNSTQVSFAVGVPESANQEGDQQIVQYANNGHPLTVTFSNGRVTNVSPSQGP